MSSTWVGSSINPPAARNCAGERDDDDPWPEVAHESLAGIGGDGDLIGVRARGAAGGEVVGVRRRVDRPDVVADGEHDPGSERLSRSWSPARRGDRHDDGHGRHQQDRCDRTTHTTNVVVGEGRIRGWPAPRSAHDPGAVRADRPGGGRDRGGKGIGAGTAKALAEAGADVVVAARTPEDLERTVGHGRGGGPAGPGRAHRRARAGPARAPGRRRRRDVRPHRHPGQQRRRLAAQPAMRTGEAAFEQALRFNVVSRSCSPASSSP